MPSTELLLLILPILTREENLTLEDIPSLKEVKHVVHVMDGNSAAGPDGFTSFLPLHGILSPRMCITLW